MRFGRLNRPRLIGQHGAGTVSGPGVVSNPDFVIEVDDNGGFSAQIDINVKGKYQISVGGQTYEFECS